MQDLKRSTTKALLWDLSGNMATHGVRFVISIFLARLLSPEDFGLIGMALVFINLSAIFIDLGFGAALIQRKSVSQEQLSSVFFFNLMISILIASAIWLLAPVIGVFYEKPVITEMVRWLCLGIPIQAATVVQVSLLSRQLDFKSLSLRTFLAGLVSGLVGIGMALAGFGYLALVGQYLTASSITFIVLWLASDWRPSFNFSVAALAQLNHFSRYIFFGKVLDQSLRQLDTLVVGKVFSAATLGFYSRARSLNQLVVVYTSGSINKVFFPVLSQLQDQPDRLRQVYLRTVGVLAFLLFGLSGLLIFAGEAIVIGLFGPKWQASVLIFQVLMLQVINYPINAVIVKTFLALGKAAENFHYGLIRSLISASTLLVAWQLGFDAFLVSLVVASYVGTLFNNFLLSRLLGIPMLQQIRRIYTYLLFALLAASLPLVIWWQFDLPLFIRALVLCSLFGLSYLAISYGLHRQELQWMYQQIIQRIRK